MKGVVGETYPRTVAMSEHGRGLDGRTIARGRHGQSGELQLGRRRGRGLRSARVQARLGRRASRRLKLSQNRAYAILARNNNKRTVSNAP